MELKEIVYQKSGESYIVMIDDEHIGTAYVEPNHKEFSSVYTFFPAKSGVIGKIEFTVTDAEFPDNLIELDNEIKNSFNIFKEIL